MRSARDTIGERSLAGRLQKLRLQRGWNMDHVAAAAGISRTTLFHLERGETSRPRASTLHKLAGVFEVSTQDLAPSVGEAGAPDAATNAIRDPRSANDDSDAFRGAFDRATNPV